MVLDWFPCDCCQCIKISSILCEKAIIWCASGIFLGTILFSLYPTPLSIVIKNHPGMCHHFYVTQAFDRRQKCLDDVKNCLSAKKLKFNPDKTEFILFGSRAVHTKPF